MLVGDPLAWDGWSRGQRTAALSWWLARMDGAPSALGLGVGDVARLLGTKKDGKVTQGKDPFGG